MIRFGRLKFKFQKVVVLIVYRLLCPTLPVPWRMYWSMHVNVLSRVILNIMYALLFPFKAQKMSLITGFPYQVGAMKQDLTVLTYTTVVFFRLEVELY